MDDALLTAAPPGLVGRFCPDDLSVFTTGEAQRFLAPLEPDVSAARAGDDDAWQRIGPRLAWELLYRLEPGLYERLIAGERLHPSVVSWLPSRVRSGIEIAAGTGRLTRYLAGRCAELLAVEPAAPLRTILAAKHPSVRVVDGFFDSIPAPGGRADLVISCSALTSDDAHGGEAGLREMERVAAPGGLIVVVWPSDVGWLRDRGFAYETFPGEMSVEFASVDEALELARIFYPHAADDIAARGLRSVPFDVLGMNPPRDLAWRRAA